MRVFILTLGTRGDLELFLILARELRSRGHRVVVGASAFYSTRVRDAGVELARIGEGTQAEFVSILRSLSSIRDRRERVLEYGRRWARPQLSASMNQIKAVAAASDYFINNLKIVLKGRDRIVPGASVTYDPPRRVEDLAKYATQWPESRGVILELVAMSKRLVDPDDLWGEQYRFTGFWRGEERPGWEPPADLRRFLDGGAPPVVITMGSMVTFDTEKFVRDMTEALRLASQRGILVSSWSGISRVDAPPGLVYCAREIPYDWLFPRAACVVHHGGCGTVAAVLRAGKPSILLPQITSQEHFAKILTREDLVAGVFDVAALQPEELTTAIRQAVTDERYQASARRWQQAVSEEPGVAGAADLIEAHWDEIKRSHPAAAP